MENNKKYYMGVLVVVFVLGLCLRACFQRTPPTNHPTMSTDFPSTDTVRVAVKDNVLEVQTPNSTEYKYVPEEGQAVIDIKHDPARPVITVTNKGFTRQFGGSVLFADKLRIGIDCEGFYWNRFGVLGGLGLASNPIVVGYVGISYQLDQLKLNNTSLWLGMTTKKDIAVGLRVAF